MSQTESATTGDNLVLHTRVVTGSGGGPDKTILNSPRFLQERGYPMVCAYLRHPDDPGYSALEQRARAWNAPLQSVDDFGPLDWRIPRRIRELCREHRPAIWHGHDYKTNLLGLNARRSLPMKLITTVHGWVKHTWKTPLYYAIDRYCLPHYDHVICVSEDLYQECLDLGVKKERCWYVANAIDTGEFCRNEPSESAKRRFDVPPGRLVVGAVGRLSEEKGFDLLIRAVAQLVEKGLDLELWIIGDGDAQESLQHLIDELGLPDRVNLLGFRGDTVDLYHAMDLFVLSSRREGLPNVVLEAMALEVPVVCTRIAGVPTLVKHEENGLIVEPDSIEELVDGMSTLLSDRDRRGKIATAGRETVVEGYSFANRMEKIKDIYDIALRA